MGQDCWNRLKGNQKTKSSNQSHPRQALLETQSLRFNHSTQNDSNFTYFNGVFLMFSLGQKLQLPEYIDQMHPSFSYQKFNSTYRQYYEQVKQLGNYIQRVKNPTSKIRLKIHQDQQIIDKFKDQSGNYTSKCCMVKYEIQGIDGSDVVSVIITHDYPQKDIKKQEIQVKKTEILEKSSVYGEIIIPDFMKSTFKVITKPKGNHFQINLFEAFRVNKLLYCDIFKLKQKGSSQIQSGDTISLRIQLVEQGQNYQDKITGIEQLHERLKKQFQNLMIDFEGEQPQKVKKRLSNHRDTLEKLYNPNSNSMY